MNRLFSFSAVVLALTFLLAPSFEVQARSANSLSRAISQANGAAATRLADLTVDKGSIRDQLTSDDADVLSALTAYKAAKTANRLSALKTFGDKSVTNRQNALTKLAERVNTGFCADIDPTVKALVLTDITNLTNSLKTQQSKIDADTDLTTTKTDVKNVFSSNRVFAHFIPAVMGICTSQTIIDLVDNKVTTIITQLTTAGKDTTQVSTDAAAVKQAASDALVLYEKVAAAPGNTDVNRTSMQTANTDLAKARASLAAVKADLEKLK